MKSILLRILFAAFVLAVSPETAPTQVSTPPLEVRVCTWKPLQFGIDPLLFAEERGLLGKRGIKLIIKENKGSSVLINEFRHGNCDLVTPQNILWLSDDVAMTRFMTNRSTYTFVGKRPLTPENLAGASIAVNSCRKGSITLAIQAAQLVVEMSKGKLTPYCGSFEDQRNPSLRKENGVYFIQAANTVTRLDAVRKGIVDFTGIVLPHEGLPEGVVAVASPEDLPDFPSHGLIFRKSWHERNPDVAEAITSAYIEAAGEMTRPEHMAEVKKALAHWYAGPLGPLSPKVVDELYSQGLNTWRLRTEPTAETLERMQKWYREYMPRFSPAETASIEFRAFDPKDILIGRD